MIGPKWLDAARDLVYSPEHQWEETYRHVVQQVDDYLTNAIASRLGIDKAKVIEWARKEPNRLQHITMPDGVEWYVLDGLPLLGLGPWERRESTSPLTGAMKIQAFRGQLDPKDFPGIHPAPDHPTT